MEHLNRTNKILLIRHGMPSALKLEYSGKRIKAKEMVCFLREYDTLGIDITVRPKEKLIEKLNMVNIAYISELKRSQATFDYFKLPVQVVSNKIFNEIELPVFSKFPLKLKPIKWLAIFRTLWFLQLAFNKKIRRQTIEKVKVAALILKDSAEKSNDVALFGHGVMNYFISKELIGLGAKQINKWEHGYWSCNEFIL
jgi:hypothetical protein